MMTVVLAMMSGWADMGALSGALRGPQWWVWAVEAVTWCFPMVILPACTDWRLETIIFGCLQYRLSLFYADPTVNSEPGSVYPGALPERLGLLLPNAAIFLLQGLLGAGVIAVRSAAGRAGVHGGGGQGGRGSSAESRDREDRYGAPGRGALPGRQLRPRGAGRRAGGSQPTPSRSCDEPPQTGRHGSFDATTAHILRRLGLWATSGTCLARRLAMNVWQGMGAVVLRCGAFLDCLISAPVTAAFAWVKACMPWLYVTPSAGLASPTSQAGNISQEASPATPPASPVTMQNVVASAIVSEECIICCERNKECVLLPCYHLCTCLKCGKKLFQKNLSCPMCRSRIKRVQKVYT
ncbi:hypothetical protein CYMTET_22261 [Cymbomonas tetramitiformis]|uniref:RING-type domain-containing protein n=1 Tax=Cymbomonas tetramitiformis TaxID=36881 RepID=A0AAE0G0R8_9CHLO|nr:hypothetical protein CYMTET_22261 [Cymbomonas tetramitiformis]